MSHPKYRKIGSPSMRIVEECGEAIQAVGKGERFGWNNRYPGGGPTNLEALAYEIADIMEAFDDLKRSVNDS